MLRRVLFPALLLLAFLTRLLFLSLLLPTLLSSVFLLPTGFALLVRSLLTFLP